jgi:hypothetical protein
VLPRCFDVASSLRSMEWDRTPQTSRSLTHQVATNLKPFSLDISSRPSKKVESNHLRLSFVDFALPLSFCCTSHQRCSFGRHLVCLLEMAIFPRIGSVISVVSSYTSARTPDYHGEWTATHTQSVLICKPYTVAGTW